jgi:phage terminase large subunit-like protein
LRADQWRIANHPAKIKTLAMGRRWGKTVLGGVLCLTAASRGQPVAWCAPTFKNARPLWRFACQATAHLQKAGLVRKVENDKLLEFPGGGFLGVYSGDNPDSLLGEAFGLVVLDEAARRPENIFWEIVEPTLADRNGECYLISTPRGYGWFYDLWQIGQVDRTGRFASWRAPTCDNPQPNIQAAYQRARETTPARRFLQEWEAEFLGDGAGVLRNVADCISHATLHAPEPGSEYLFGVDFGRHSDATAIAIYDVRKHKIAAVITWVDMPFEEQIARLAALYAEWGARTILAERNSFGEPLIERLRKMGVNVVSFTTTLASKNELIDGLALALQTKAIGLPNDAALIKELEAYEGQQLPSGLWKYGAPGGMHDDRVMAVGLAVYGGRKNYGAPLIYFELDAVYDEWGNAQLVHGMPY